MIFFVLVISAVLAVGLAAALGYLLGHRVASRATRELVQSQSGCWIDEADATRAVRIADELDCGLVDAISAEFAMMIRYQADFSLVVLDIDNIEQMRPEQSAQALRSVDGQLAEVVRETDAVIRHGGNHFFVLMPRTDLMGACEFAERFRQTVEDGSAITLSGGITMALDGDSPSLMVIRAHEALAVAKQSGDNRVYRHDGIEVEPILEFAFASTSADDVARG